MTNKNKYLINDNIKKINYGNFQFISSWKDHYKSWKYYKKFRILYIKYEDLENNPLDMFLKIISFINEYYSSGKKYVFESSSEIKEKENLDDIEKKIIQILETKIRPAVARDGGDIKFKEFKNGKVTVEMQGSCSGCPSSTMTLKRGVENLLKHYVPEVTEVIPV